MPTLTPSPKKIAAKTPTKRQELGARSRDEILNAAEKIMAVHGFEGTSIARIASESGLPSSSIYWHFESKAGVLAAVMERGAERFFSDYGANIDLVSPVVDPLTTLRQSLGFAKTAVEAHPEFLRMLFLLTLSGVHDERVTGLVRRVTDAGKDQLGELIRHVFTQQGEAMSLRIADELVDFAQGMFDGMFLTTQTHEGVSYDRLIDQMAETIFALGSAIIRRDS